MAYIYKVTNLINGKIYIGKTLLTVEKRWKEHCEDYKKQRNEKRPLYSAMNKYGIENFKVEQIEECSDKNINEREVYWIEYYQSFKQGYNATIGGDGKAYLDYDLICETYKQVQNATKTSELCHCNVESVRRILKERKIEIISSSEISRRKNSKIVNQFSLDGDFIQSFKSLSDAARCIQSLDLKKRTEISSIRTHISEVARNKRKTAYGFIWKYSE